MIYVMSDLHGCFLKYRVMLDKINLTLDDTLYVLGDVVDRGPDGIKILQDMMNRKNVRFLLGNHDYMAMEVLRCMHDSKVQFSDDELVPLIQMWVSDGGASTLEQFLSLPSEDRSSILDYIGQAELAIELTVNGLKYHLSHTVPEREEMLMKNNLSLDDCIMGEPDYELKYYDEKILVTGHTPTGLIEEASTGRIFIRNNHIAVDCGAVFDSGRLGCICLDTMEEFYV